MARNVSMETLSRKSKRQRVWEAISKLDSEWVSTRALAEEASVGVKEIVPFLIYARRMKLLKSQTRVYYDNCGFRHRVTFWRKK